MELLRVFIQKNKIGKNILILLLTLSATIGISVILSSINNNYNPFAMALFIMSVVIVARWTDGYIWRIVVALIGTFCVNYIFTYPFVNDTGTGIICCRSDPSCGRYP